MLRLVIKIVAYLKTTHTRNVGLQIFNNIEVSVSIPNEVIRFCNLPNPSSRTMALGLTQPLTEMNMRNLPGGKGRPTRKADNLTAVCESMI
jgi:hypothetical protein